MARQVKVEVVNRYKHENEEERKQAFNRILAACISRQNERPAH